MTEMRNEERERANLRGGPEFMVFQQPTQRLVADNLPKSEVFDRRRRRQRCVDGHVAETLMRPKVVIIIYPRFQDLHFLN
jgi:hypothetical protein